MIKLLNIFIVFNMFFETAAIWSFSESILIIVRWNLWLTRKFLTSIYAAWHREKKSLIEVRPHTLICISGGWGADTCTNLLYYVAWSINKNLANDMIDGVDMHKVAQLASHVRINQCNNGNRMVISAFVGIFSKCQCFSTKPFIFVFDCWM